MTLYMIGLGLNDEKDISVKGLEAVKKCDFVYLESYTSKLQCSVSKMEKMYGKKIIIADRDLVEKKAETEILEKATKKNIAFLVIGDVFGATTHTDLMMRAKEKKIKTEVIHNASIINAVGIVGLELYKYGKTTSIPFDNKNVVSPIKIIKDNLDKNMHTLVLLDLDPINNKFMTTKEAIRYLIDKGVSENLKGVVCGAIGSNEPEIKSGKLKELKGKKLNKFPQCIIIAAKELHFIEEEMMDSYK